MKKTVSIHIKGMNFLIEEDAYELLQTYMDRLNHSLRNEKGSKEIIEDIEYRVAELCGLELNDKKQVIEKEDIEKIIETLGQPEDYVDDSETDEKVNNLSDKTENVRGEKRLYRDITHARIAGVCAGLSNYLHIDVVIVRILFLLILFFAGFGLPLYIILWIVLPKAENTVDRLRMQGKPITVESVKEEVEMAAARIKNETQGFAHKVRKGDYFQERLSSIARFFQMLIGIFIMGIGVFLAVLMTFGLIGMNFIPVGSDDGLLSINDLGSLVLANGTDVFWLWTSILIFGFSTLLFLFLLGSKLIFHLRNRWTKISLTSLFFTGLIGFIMCLYIGVKAGQEMTIEGEIERVVGTVNATTLEVEPHFDKLKNSDDFNIKSSGPQGMVSIEGEQIVGSGIHFEYRESRDSLFHIIQNLSAHSSSHRKALNKAKNIRHNVSLTDTTLHLGTLYRYPKKDKLRDQEVYIIIEIPKGKTVLIDKQIVRLEREQWDDFDDDFPTTREGKLYSNGNYVDWN